MSGKEITELINKTASDLGEHFDAVQILVSWNDNGQTTASYSGCGNWYARQGMAHEFINSDVAQENARQMKGILPNNPPDNGESWKSDQ